MEFIEIGFNVRNRSLTSAYWRWRSVHDDRNSSHSADFWEFLFIANNRWRQKKKAKN